MVIVIGWQVYDIARQTMGLKEAALRLGIIGVVQFVPLFLLTLVTGWTADRLDRRWIARAALALELGCALALALFAWTSHHDARDPVRRRGSARRRPRLRRTGVGSARAQPRSAQDPAARDRPVVDGLADRRDPRAGDRRLPLRLRALRALRRERGPVRHRLPRAPRHPAGPAHRADATGPTPGRRWSRACATSATTASCSEQSASTCSRSCSAERRRCCRFSRATCSTRDPKVSAICARRPRSAQP